MNRDLIEWLEAMALSAPLPEFERKKLRKAADELAACARLRTALEALVEKLNDVHEDQQYQTVWMLAAQHGYKYSGLTYHEELEAAEAALSLPEDGGGRTPEDKTP